MSNNHIALQEEDEILKDVEAMEKPQPIQIKEIDDIVAQE